MDTTRTADVQKLINACETVIKSASDNGGLSQADCDIVLFYARALLQEVKPLCVENHSRENREADRA
jgi:predicted GNAT family acetyltransferase